jgi:hypothetical protein
MSETGTTTSDLNLRSGPGTGNPVLETLPVGTGVTIVERVGDWLDVRVTATGRAGFVSGRFVHLPAVEVVSGWLIHDRSVRDAPLAPPRPRQAPAGSGDAARTAARIWNAYGGVLERLAERLGIEAEAGVAVMSVESGGTAFVDGRMVIRFENHVFWDRWGKQNADVFGRHFRFGTPQRWKGHEFRATAQDPWRSFHGKQSGEWEVFRFAEKLARVPARQSISMGLPQIMGFNAAAIGYASVDEMFDAFNDPAGGERAQAVGLFDFVKGPKATSQMLDALRQHDWVAFAKRYNGSGQAAVYGQRIADAYTAAKGLVGG